MTIKLKKEKNSANHSTRIEGKVHQNGYLAVLKGSWKWGGGVAHNWTLATHFFVCFSIPQALAKR